MNPHFIYAAGLAMLLAFVGGCASTESAAPSASAAADNDPMERVNRAIFRYNLNTDKYILRPVAKVYRYTPNRFRRGVGNFFSNLGEPYTVLNDLLQAKFAKAGRDGMRFLINSSIGVFGFMDIAQRFGLEKQREDFGQTLAVWGVPPGPYVMLPFFGPRNVRDTFGFAPELLTGADPVNQLDSPERWHATGLRVIDARANLFGFDEVLALQPDQYLFVRENYRQLRRIAIHDGNPPDAEDELEDALLEDDF